MFIKYVINHGMQANAIGQIQQQFLERVRKNPHYSLRAFARDLGLSPSFLSRLLNGERSVSDEVLLKIARELDLKELKNDARKPSSGARVINLDLFKVIAEWEHYAILHLVHVKDFTDDPKWIAKRIGISAHIAKRSYQRLFEVGMLYRSEQGIVKAAHLNTRLPTKKSELSVREHHSQMIEQGLKELKNSSQEAFDKRVITGQTFAVSEEGFQKVKKAISVLQKEVLKSAALGPHENVYQLNIQLFPHTKKLKEEKK